MAGDDGVFRAREMEAALAADPNDPFHSFMLNGYAYMGISRAAEMLAEIRPAAGVGRRLGCSGPKALVPIGGRPMLAKTLEPFAALGLAHVDLVPADGNPHISADTLVVPTLPQPVDVPAGLVLLAALAVVGVVVPLATLAGESSIGPALATARASLGIAIM